MLIEWCLIEVDTFTMAECENWLMALVAPASISERQRVNQQGDECG